MKRRLGVAGWGRLVRATAVLATVAAVVEAAPPRGLTTGAWKLERIVLHDGRRLEGLVVPADPAAGDTGSEIRFAQVVRPPGRPMYVITWGPLPPEAIKTVDRLPPAEHDQLAGRVKAFLESRHRRGDAETAIRLRRDGDEGPWRYETDDVVVESTADATTTRAAIVTLDQVFGGLRALVPPPRKERPPTIRVRLCGSATEYREVQRELGIHIDNPAFYVPARRLLVAGGDMPAMVADTAVVEDGLAAADQRYEELDRLLEDRLKALAADLEQQGFPAAKRAEIVQLARQRWDRERADEVARIATARRENAGRRDRALATFRSRLAHEAWHAYADAVLAGGDAAGLPLWLDEGLAQVIESAPLEAGELRLDAPDPKRLAALQEAVRGGALPTVAELVQAGQEQFLAGHASDADQGRFYLAAWGVALDLAMLRPVLSPTGIADITAANDDAVAAFERLAGAPVDAYDTGWRRRILALRPGRAVVPDDGAAVNPGR
jgi:hypothetical protein